MMVADDFEHGRSTTSYSLYLPRSGNQIPLLPAGIVLAEPGESVVVRGEVEDDELIGSVQGESYSRATPLNPETEQEMQVELDESGLDAREVAMVLLRFPGDPAEPWSPALTRHIAFSGADSARAFYEEESYGKISLVGADNPEGDVFGWYTLSEPAQGCTPGVWWSEGEQALISAGVSPADYDHIMFVTTPQPCGWRGLGLVAGKFSGANGNTPSRTVIHELGHNLGLRHANLLECSEGGQWVQISSDCSSLQTGDPFDVMGAGTRHHNSRYLEHLGVLSPANIRTVTASGTYTLTSLLTPTDEPAVLRIARTRDSAGNVLSWYYLEIREQGGFFETVLDSSMSGVSIRLVGAFSGSDVRTDLVDANPGSVTEGPPLAVGQTFDGGNLRITTLAAGDGKATVSVEMGAHLDGRPPARPEIDSIVQRQTDVELDWSDSADNVGTRLYSVVRDGTTVGTSSTSSFIDRNVAVGNHAYVVYAEDEAGNLSEGSPAWTATVVDVTAPTAPSKLGVVQELNHLKLSWGASSDDVGVSRYKIRRDGVEIGTSAMPTFRDEGAPPGSHRYGVFAEDAAGNRSPTAAVSAMVVDVTPPTSPGDLAAASGSAGVRLRWSPSSDDVGVSRYLVFRNGAEVGSISDTTFTDTAAPGEHLYVVIAEDAAGNRSIGSAPATVAIAGPAPAGSPGVPGPARAPRTVTSPRKPTLSWRRGPAGALRLKADARRDQGVVRLELWLGGRLLRSADEGLIRLTLKPGELPCAASFSVSARAYDAGGAKAVVTRRVTAWGRPSRRACGSARGNPGPSAGGKASDPVLRALGW